jgi:hypothetical protein
MFSTAGVVLSFEAGLLLLLEPKEAKELVSGNNITTEIQKVVASFS